MASLNSFTAAVQFKIEIVFRSLKIGAADVKQSIFYNYNSNEIKQAE